MDEEYFDYLWDYAAACFSNIPAAFQDLLNFAASHQICISVFICFLVSAAVITIKRLCHTFTR